MRESLMALPSMEVRGGRAVEKCIFPIVHGPPVGHPRKSLAEDAIASNLQCPPGALAGLVAYLAYNPMPTTGWHSPAISVCESVSGTAARR